MKSDFVGGVSDGKNGIATMAYERDGLVAKKSWFFFDDAIVCLGAGISASGKADKVNTSINQSFLNGNVTIKKTGAAELVTKGKHKIDNLFWLIHDKWGYYFPGSASVNLLNTTQTGDWSKVAVRYPKKEEKADLFTLWIDHDSNPKADKYAYYVFPAATEKDIEKRAAAIKLKKNTEEVQLTEVEKKGILGVVFFKPALVETELVNKLRSDKACVMMIEKANKKLNVTVSDPSHLESKITIGIQGEIKSETHPAKYDKSKNMTFITVDLPQGPEAGKSLTFILSR
jgi:chondroitin AC lyase